MESEGVLVLIERQSPVLPAVTYIDAYGHSPCWGSLPPPGYSGVKGHGGEL